MSHKKFFLSVLKDPHMISMMIVELLIWMMHVEKWLDRKNLLCCKFYRCKHFRALGKTDIFIWIFGLHFVNVIIAIVCFPMQWCRFQSSYWTSPPCRVVGGFNFNCDNLFTATLLILCHGEKIKVKPSLNLIVALRQCNYPHKFHLSKFNIIKKGPASSR